MTGLQPYFACLEMLLLVLLLHSGTVVGNEGGEIYSDVKETVVGQDSLDEALDSLPFEGGLLRLVYNNSEATTVMDTLIVRNRRVTIQGQGKKGPALTCNGDEPALRIIGGHVNVMDLAIHGCIGTAVEIDSPKDPIKQWEVQIHRCMFVGNGHAIKKRLREGGDRTEGYIKIRESSLVSSTASAVEVHGVKSLLISESKFVNNTSSQHHSGGGILFHQRKDQEPWSLIVLQSVFKHNTAYIGGGGVFATSCVDGSVIVEDSTFLNNSARQGGGLTSWGYLKPAMDSPNITVNIRKTHFVGSLAHSHSGGGGISLKRIASSVVESSVFERCSSTGNGGGLVLDNRNSDRSWTLRVLNSLFNGNRGKNEGGGISVESEMRGIVSVKESIFTNNVAGIGGGLTASAIWNENFDFPNITVVIQECIFRNNSASSTIVDGGGGGLHLMNIAGIVESTLFESCSAQYGAGLYWIHTEKGGSLSLRFSNFSKNAADGDGGGGYIQGLKHLLMEGCNIEENTCEGGGGGIYLEDARLPYGDIDVWDSNFAGNKALVGGALYGENIQGLDTKNNIFAKNEAVVGGGIVLTPGSMTDMYFSAEESYFVGNSARGEVPPGLDFPEFVPFSGGGGAIAIIAFLRSKHRKELYWAIYLTSSVFKHNKAGNGGAVLGFVPQSNGREWLGITNCTFQDNSAMESGGAIAVDNPDYVSVACEIEEEVYHLLSGNCESWKGNSVVSGSGMDGAPNTVAAISLGRIQLNHSHIGREQSRPYFPPISLTIWDALNKTRSFGGIGEVEVIGECHERNVVLLWDTKQFAKNGSVVLNGIRAWGLPGNYTITLKATNIVGFYRATTVQANLTFELRDCEVGERNVMEVGGYLGCEHCNEKFFSLNPTDEACKECIENAECDASKDNRVHPLVPRDGYWHSSPFSKQIHKCISHVSCRYDGRKEALQSFKAPHLPRRPTRYSRTEYPLCKEGSDGPLCGSCREGYGHVKNGQCAKCESQLWPTVGIIAGGIWTALLMWITIYGNFPSLKDADQETETQGMLLVEMQRLNQEHSDTIEGGEEHQNTIHEAVQEEDRRSGKTIVQLFKIGVNFFQVNSTGLLMSFGWISFLRAWMELQDVSTLASASSHGNWLVPQCAFQSKSDRAVLVAHLDVALPVILAFLIAAAWTSLRLLRTSFYPLSTEIEIIFWNCALYAYNGLTRSFMGMLNCIQVDKNQPEDTLNYYAVSKGLYWVGDTDFHCFHGLQRVVSLLTGFIGASLFLIGLPTYLCAFLYRMGSHLGDIHFVNKYGFLYQTYKSDYAYWEAVIMFRKFLVTTIGVFAASLGPQLQGYLLQGVVVGAMMLQMGCKPFRDQNLNFMEAWSLVTTGCTFYLGGVMSERSAVWKLLLSGIVLCMNVVFSVALAVKLVNCIIEEGILRKVSRNPYLCRFMSISALVREYCVALARNIRRRVWWK